MPQQRQIDTSAGRTCNREPNRGRFADQEFYEMPYRYELSKYLEVPRSTSFNQMLVALIPCLKDY